MWKSLLAILAGILALTITSRRPAWLDSVVQNIGQVNIVLLRVHVANPASLFDRDPCQASVRKSR